MTDFDNATIDVDRLEENFFIIRKDIAVRFGATAALIYACADKEAIINWDYGKIKESLPFLSDDRIGSSLGGLPGFLEGEAAK